MRPLSLPRLCASSPPRRAWSLQVDMLVGGECQELDEVGVQRDLLEELRGLGEAALTEYPLAERLFELDKFLALDLLDERARDGSPVGETRPVSDPLPDLRARDLRSGGVLHQVIDRCGARAAQPGSNVLDADADVAAQAGLGDLPAGDGRVQQILGLGRHIRPLLAELIWSVAQDGVEALQR